MSGGERVAKHIKPCVYCWHSQAWKLAEMCKLCRYTRICPEYTKMFAGKE